MKDNKPVDFVMVGNEKYVREKDVKKAVAPKGGDRSNPLLVVGEDYFIRTVTQYFTGRLVWVGDKEIAIEDAAWIADTGRFNEFLVGKTVDEVEPFPRGETVLVGRGSIIDMVRRRSGLLRDVK